MTLNLGPYNPRIVLTGAGFSKNWGGLLAKEVRERMLRYLDENRTLRDLLVPNPNFEAVAHKVDTDDSFSAQDRATLRTAVRGAFHEMDDEIRQTMGPTAWLRDLLTAVADRGNRVGGLTSCLFTLNQDLLVERWWTAHAGPKITVPCAQAPDWWFGGRIGPYTARLSPSHRTAVSFQRKRFEDAVRGRTSYLKLHGSAEWRDPNHGDVLVIGGNKPETIARFPILATSFELFREALCAGGDVRLLVIGYSFCDDHVNEVIREGVTRGLKLYTVDKFDIGEKLVSLFGANAVGLMSSAPETALAAPVGGRWPHPIDRFLQG